MKTKLKKNKPDNGDATHPVRPEENQKEENLQTNFASTSTQPDSTSATTRIPFSSLPLCPPTLRALSEMGLTHTTPIQSASTPILLAGRDVLGAARTGSGKTLAFLLPAIELLHRLKFKPQNGTGVVIISPTRELALQIFGVVREVMNFHSQTFEQEGGGGEIDQGREFVGCYSWKVVGPFLQHRHARRPNPST